MTLLLETMELPRLDILLYAHDGRGLGHASRTIAIGMALRRIAPNLRVLFVSGCKVSRELISPVKLDWVKLPSYETEVIDGKSRGAMGNSMFSDQQLGALRAEQLKQLIDLYRPRLVLADHSPQGKHRELVPALMGGSDARWVLGVRGVVGEVSQVRSDLAAQLYSEYYSSLFWYGDRGVLGGEHLERLKRRYGVQPRPCGYVSRLVELIRHSRSDNEAPALAGTLSVPWFGEHTLCFLNELTKALIKIGPEHGDWQLFIDSGNDPVVQHQVDAMYQPLSFCRVKPISGVEYLQSLQQSRCALIYGGYNSVMDVLSLSLPSVVVMRAMKDNEQQEHLARLTGASSGLLRPVEEQEVGAEELSVLLREALEREPSSHQIDLNGAEQTAQLLIEMLADVKL